MAANSPSNTTGNSSSYRKKPRSGSKIRRWRMIRQSFGTLQKWSKRYLAIIKKVFVRTSATLHRAMVLLDPLFCLFFIGTGVSLTMVLPQILWSGLFPLLKQYSAVLSLTSFPVAGVPDGISATTFLLSVLPPSLAVFRRYYQEWKNSEELLLTKAFFAMYAGICWPKAWWRRRA